MSKNLWAMSARSSPDVQFGSVGAAAPREAAGVGVPWQAASGAAPRRPEPYPSSQAPRPAAPGAEGRPYVAASPQNAYAASSPEEARYTYTPSPYAEHSGASHSPGPPQSQVDQMHMIDHMSKGYMQALDKIIDKLSGPAEASDRYQTISASEFKRSPPKIRDDDPDLDRYDLMFDNMIQCLSVGKQKVNDYNKLLWYASGFLDGSTRRKVHDNAIRKGDPTG